MNHEDKKTKYQILLTKSQLEGVEKACDYFCRIAMGQFEDVVALHLQSRSNLIPSYYEDGYGEQEPEFKIDNEKVQRKIVELRAALGLKKSNYFSIHSIKLDYDPKCVFDVYQKINYQLGKASKQVPHPIKAAKDPLPIIKPE